MAETVYLCGIKYVKYVNEVCKLSVKVDFPLVSVHPVFYPWETNELRGRAGLWKAI